MTDYAALLTAIEARLREIERRCAGAVEARVWARSDWPGVRLLGERIAEEDLGALVGWALEMVEVWRYRNGVQVWIPGDDRALESLARALGIEVS